MQINSASSDDLSIFAYTLCPSPIGIESRLSKDYD